MCFHDDIVMYLNQKHQNEVRVLLNILMMAGEYCIIYTP